jgi:hypothetical protein
MSHGNNLNAYYPYTYYVREGKNQAKSVREAIIR